MKAIKIAERLSPFSHQPETALMLPGTTFFLQIFPTLLRAYDLSGTEARSLGEVTFALQGPVRDFTVIQDLERVEIRVSGHAAEGYFRYVVRPEGLQIVKGNIAVKSQAQIFGKGIRPTSTAERLSLGSHKAQEWPLMQRRLLLEELLPLWLRLGGLTPMSDFSLPPVGTGYLVHLCREGIQKRDKEAILSHFENLFRAAFSGLLVPRTEDTQHQGFSLPPIQQPFSPLHLLTEGAKLIRRLFVQQQENTLYILPALPPQFHAGRLIAVDCPPYGQLDLEWSKKKIRRLIFRSHMDAEIKLQFPSKIKSYRLQQLSGAVSLNSLCEIRKGEMYHLDRFSF